MRFRVPMRWATAGLLFSVVSASSVGLFGCAHADTVADRHITEMGEQIGKEQADQDKWSAKTGLMDTKPEPTPARGNGANAKNANAPHPPSATLGDDDTRESDDPNDPNARPEIRLQGPAGAAAAQARSSSSSSSSSARNKSRRDADREPSSPSSAEREANKERASILDPEAKRAYESAHQLVTSKQYDRALEALASFISRWPDHPYAENATYWRGEAYFAKGEYLRAAEQFEAVLTRYTGTKAPDALLKIGICHERLGSGDRAREYWERLRRDYPRSDAVKRIPEGRATERSSGGSGPR